MIVEWIRLHETLIGYLGVISVLTFFLTLIIVPVLIIRMPSDYFVYDKQDLKQFHRQHPLVRVVFLVLKNIIGIIFIFAGLAMLILPGQGVVSILIGMTLISFPKKRVLECRIIQQRSVVRTINWMRDKARRVPLELPPCAKGYLPLASEEAACTGQGNVACQDEVFRRPNQEV